jgi:5-methylcytosine-specific restriction endonuclease McrA
MPSLRPCLEPGCRVLSRGVSRCPAHAKPWTNRPVADGRYSTYEWRKLRARVIQQEPICQLGLPGCTHYSKQVDHILSANDRPDLFLTRSNLRGVCASCHHRRSAEQSKAKRKRKT